MFIAIRYMEDEAHALAEAVGGFETLDAAEAFIEKHWADWADDNMCEAFELAAPQTYQGV